MLGLFWHYISRAILAAKLKLTQHVAHVQDCLLANWQGSRFTGTWVLTLSIWCLRISKMEVIHFCKIGLKSHTSVRFALTESPCHALYAVQVSGQVMAYEMANPLRPKQDGWQGKCPFGGQMFARQGKVLSWLSSFGDNAPGLLSTQCKFRAHRLNPGWASQVNASHTKVSNFRSDCIVFAVFC